MNLEEKLHKELDWLTIKHIDADGIIRNILSICKPEIAEACKKQTCSKCKHFVDLDIVKDIQSCCVNKEVETISWVNNPETFGCNHFSPSPLDEVKR